MSDFIAWNSQPFNDWAEKYAKGKFINLDGHKTHYIEKGKGEPIILLHGFNYDSYLWDANIEALAEQFHVYALDLWGFGYSTREPLDYGYELYVEQILLFMDSLGIPKASLMGQSMGGGTAIKFCVNNPDRVQKLLLVAAAGMPHTFPLLARVLCLPSVGEFFMGLKTNLIKKKNLGDFWIHDRNLISEDYFENASRYQKIKETTECALYILRKQFFFTLNDDINQLAKLNTPILIVWGREDKSIPLNCGEAMHNILKGSQFVIMENAGHVPNFEHKDKFNQLAIDFLRE